MASRERLLKHLRSSPYLEPTNGADDPTWHGRGLSLSCANLDAPVVTWQSQQKPRADKHGYAEDRTWLTATEYKDTTATLQAKVRFLAQLLRASHHTMAYTGAGLSVAAGIAQAAAGSTKFRKHVSVEADPTLAHCVLARLNIDEYLHAWVQQNHDGLPQKAGVKQECINEIHGSWYDPSNPVVKYSGTLREDLCDHMYNEAKIADLCLVMGTSLSGLNADRCPEKTAARSLAERALGSVIIGPQRTPQDGWATLRIFGTADDVMVALAKEMDLDVPMRPRRAVFTPEVRVRVPYDRRGRKSESVCTIWDLSAGSKVHVSEFNNIEGAQQPAYMHITHETEGRVLRRNATTCSFDLSFDSGSVRMSLGLWFVDAAKRGALDRLPVVNVDATEYPISALHKKEKEEKHAAVEEKQEKENVPRRNRPSSSKVQLPPFLRVVQSHRRLDENQSEWKLRVVTPDGYPLNAADFVDSVTYKLHHPTFNPSSVNVSNSNSQFEITRRGWGVFVVEIAVIFKAGWGQASEAPLIAKHELVFTRDVSETRVAVPPNK